MCLAYLGKIKLIKGSDAIVDFFGIEKEINVSFVKVRVGDYVMVHAGFAIEKLKEKEAQEIFKLYESK